MYDFKSTQTIESAVLPGVRFTIRKATHGRRTELHLAIAEASRKYDDALTELNKLRIVRKEEDGTEKQVGFTDEKEAFRLAADAEMINHSQLIPTYLRWGFIEIEGLEIDGRAPDVEMLIADGPEGLIPEIVDAIKANLGMTVQAQKNSQSPTTSCEAAGAEPKPTIASTAKPLDYGAVAPETEGAPVSAI